MTQSHPRFQGLAAFLGAIPGITVVSAGEFEDQGWWLKLDIDIHAGHAWHLVQELGHVLNYVSLEERLPTVFKPVSSPPYMNGGPSDFLSWVIECSDRDFAPVMARKWLEGRLPAPANDLSAWEALEE